jgi:hypothetical protein
MLQEAVDSLRCRNDGANKRLEIRAVSAIRPFPPELARQALFRHSWYRGPNAQAAPVQFASGLSCFNLHLRSSDRAASPTTAKEVETGTIGGGTSWKGHQASSDKPCATLSPFEHSGVQSRSDRRARQFSYCNARFQRRLWQ